jgi:hypothetical protein
MQLMLDNFDRVKALVTALCSLTEAEVDNLTFDDLLLVVYAEWSINERFFTNQVIPMIQQLRTNAA